MIKKLLFLVIAIVICGGIGYAASSHYDQYQKNKNAEATAAKAKSATELKQVQTSAATERAAMVKQYNLVREECVKGQTAYAKLTTANQKLLAQPQCGEPIK